MNICNTPIPGVIRPQVMQIDRGGIIRSSDKLPAPYVPRRRDIQLNAHLSLGLVAFQSPVHDYTGV